MLQKIFGFDSTKHKVRTEIIAGITTFMSMAYILAVNPAILSHAGMDEGALFTATALASAAATILIAIYAKMPLAQAPSMGINAFFAYTLVGAMGYSWQTALTITFVEGILFILLTAFNIREKIIKAIPHSLNIAIPAGLGFFIAFIGLQNGEVIVGNSATLVSQGNFNNPMLISLLGIILCGVFVQRKLKGALFLSIIICTVVSIITGAT
ncbi:MAG: NCS2 family permease, partial [Rikenellaceae bacterium]